jgi:hypothetical protein
MYKYYFRIDSLNNKPITLNQVDYSDYSEMRYDNSSRTWVPTDRVFHSVISGSLDYEECSIDEAKDFAPDAFI